MKNTFSRRSFIASSLALAAGGCVPTLNREKPRTTLPSNTFNGMLEGEVKIGEDKINFQKVGLLDVPYFVIPLNNQVVNLKGGEPSFALIPENEARITVKDVGIPGGRVVVDAPEGGIYFPYAYDSGQKLSLDFANQEPVKFVTNFKMEDIRLPEKSQGKISLDTITERNLPFADEALQMVENQRYLVNRAGDITNSSVLPMYLTELPISVEYDRTKKDGNLRIIGDTYVFQKGLSTKDYLQARGYANPITNKEKARKNIQTIKVDKKKK